MDYETRHRPRERSDYPLPISRLTSGYQPHAYGRVLLLAAAPPARSSRSLITVMTILRHYPKEAIDLSLIVTAYTLSYRDLFAFLVLSLAALHSRVHQYVSRPRDRSHRPTKFGRFQGAENRSSPLPTDEPFRCLPYSSKNTFDTALTVKTVVGLFRLSYSRRKLAAGEPSPLLTSNPR